MKLKVWLNQYLKTGGNIMATKTKSSSACSTSKTMSCCNTAVKAAPKKSAAPQNVNFNFYAPLAKKVSLGGSFNNWDAKKNALKGSKKGLWTTTLKLKPGRYEYRFSIDGRWENDNQRQTELVGNGYGEVNNVLSI